MNKNITILFILSIFLTTFAFAETNRVIDCLIPACEGAYPTGEFDGLCPIFDCPIEYINETRDCPILVCPPGEVPVTTERYDENRCPITVCIRADYDDKTEEIPIDEIMPVPPSRDVPDFSEPIYILPPSRDTPITEPIEVGIYTTAEGKIITIKTEQGYTTLRDSDKMIQTDSILRIENDTLYVDGSATKRIDILPSQAYTIATEELKIINPIIEIKEFDVPAYEVRGTKKVKIMGIISADMNIVSRIDIETGHYEITERPWWSFLTIS